MRNLKKFFNKLIISIKNKSLRWHIMVCVFISLFFMFIGLILTIRLNYSSFKTLNNIYVSNSELNSYSNLITETEKAMENYVEFHTFESIDTYFSNINQIQLHCEEMNNNPSTNVILQKEFIVYQLSNSDRKSTRLNSSHQIISYAVFCVKKKKTKGERKRKNAKIGGGWIEIRVKKRL